MSAGRGPTRYLRNQRQYSIIRKGRCEMIQAGGGRGLHNLLSVGIYPFDPKARACSRKVACNPRARLWGTIRLKPRHRLEPLGLRPEAKTAIRNRPITPEAVHNQTVGRAYCVPLGKLKQGAGSRGQVWCGRHPKSGSRLFVPAEQPDPFIMMARLDQELTGLQAWRQRLIKILRQRALLRLEKPGEEKSGEIAGPVEKTFIAECVACCQQRLEEVRVGILPSRAGARNVVAIPARRMNELRRNVVRDGNGIRMHAVGAHDLGGRRKGEQDKGMIIKVACRIGRSTVEIEAPGKASIGKPRRPAQEIEP